MKQTFLLLLIISSFSYGQTKYDQYDDLISSANSLKKEGNYNRAIEQYHSALKILNPNSGTPFFNLGECAIQIGDTSLANVWIRKGISVGGAPKTYLEKYIGFENLKETTFFKNIIKDYNELRQEYFSNIENIDVYLEIEELTARDQFVRKIDDYINGISKKDMEDAMEGYQQASIANDTVALQKYKELLFPKPNNEYQKLQNELIIKVDALNIDRLMEITKEHGWQERAWIILWHQRGNHDEDNYVWNYFRPLINKEIEEGKISRSFWYAFDQFKEMMDNGNMGTIQIGEKPQKKKEKE